LSPSTQSIESAVGKIVEASSKSREEVQRMIDEKKSRFSGLLTESGAAFMIAKELGVNLDFDSGTETKVAGLKEGTDNVDVLARVMHVFSPKSFEKNGKKGLLCNLLVADDSGEVRLTLWHHDVAKLWEQKVERGDILLLKNCSVSTYNEKKQLSLNYGGQFILNKKKNAAFPEPNTAVLKVKELKAGIDNADVFGKIARVFDERSFEREGRNGKLLSFELADETAVARCTAWNDLVEEAKKLRQGMLVKIEGAYTKDGLRGVELQLGWQARILQNPRGFELDTVVSGAERKEIAKLEEGETIEVKAKIKEILPGKLHYLVCPNCSKKVEQIGEGYVCEQCGEVEEPNINLIVAVELQDKSGSMRCVFFGKQAETLIEKSREEMKKELEEKGPDALIEEIKEKVVGREATVEARVKKGLGGEKELVARSIQFKQ